MYKLKVTQALEWYKVMRGKRNDKVGEYAHTPTQTTYGPMVLDVVRIETAVVWMGKNRLASHIRKSDGTWTSSRVTYPEK
jgi:hypothetical protein